MTQKTETQSRMPETDQQRDMLRSTATDTDRWRRRDPFELFAAGPFAAMRRMQEDMDRLFGRIAPGGRRGVSQQERVDWMPDIDVFQRGNELVIRADVPGLSPDDLSVEIGDEAVTIQGDRQSSHEEERDGVFMRERVAGRFCRVIPLPDGAIGDEAKASFKNGVLEVAVPAPSPEARRGRRVEIQHGSTSERAAGTDRSARPEPAGRNQRDQGGQPR